MTIQRYEMHTTQCGSEMRRHHEGEWCDADDVLELEHVITELKSAMRQIEGLMDEDGFDSDYVLERIDDIVKEQLK